MVPRLRFPEFRDASVWEPKALRDITDHITRKVGEKQLTPVSISAGSGFVSQAEKFGRDISGAQYRNYIHLQRGDFSYNKGNSKRFPQGAVYELRDFEEAAVPSAFVSFRFRDGYENGFFQPLFERNSHGLELRRFITSGARSDGLLNVSPDEFLSVTLPVPPTPAEQRKIAECLTSLDELIAAEGRKLEALRAHKKSLMQNLFPREGESTPALRFPKFQKARHWTRKPFGEAATFYNGRAYAKEELLETGRYRVLRVGNFFTNDKWYFSDLELEETKYCTTGDLLYAWSASFGPRTWTGEKVIYHYHIWKVMEKKDIDRSFLALALEVETERIRTRMANGIGMFHITKGTIEAWEAGFPEPEEQHRIASCLASLDTLITAQAKKLDILKLHKQGLMQGLFPSPEGR